MSDWEEKLVAGKERLLTLNDGLSQEVLEARATLESYVEIAGNIVVHHPVSPEVNYGCPDCNDIDWACDCRWRSAK